MAKKPTQAQLNYYYAHHNPKGKDYKPPAKKPAKTAARAKVSARPKATAKAARWSPDSAVACCAARAVAESLRLALDVSVSGGDVLALYWRTAGDPDAGATILATLQAAREHGLGGYRPSGFALAGMHEPNERLILHVQMPDEHALTADGPVWWSWGEPYRPDAFPGAVIEEAWAVTW